MIFKKIIFTNLFSYEGECVFDFQGLTKEKNIVLISGRNGFGKTSFLNAVKLLFTGVTDELRKEVQRQRKPSEKQYILGAGDNWWGAMNHHARNKGKTFCGVKIIWEEDGKDIIATREWKISHQHVDMSISIQYKCEELLLEDDKAQQFLRERLPEEYVPFFFYDGEKIQKLAEANVAQTAEHIERLLNISDVNNLRDALKSSIATWKKDGADDKLAALALEELKNNHSLQDKKLESILQDKEELKYEVAQFDDEKQEIQRKLESSRSFINQKDEASIKESIKKAVKEKNELLVKLADTLPQDIFLLSNEYLINSLATKLGDLLNDKSSTNNHLIEELLEFLPDDLFERPQFPPILISNDQKKFYKQKLRNKIKEYAGIGKNKLDHNDFFELSIPNAKKIKAIIQPYINSRLLRVERKQDLDKMQALNNTLDDLENERLNISSLSEDERRYYEKLKITLKKLEEDRDRAISSQGELGTEENHIQRKKEDLEKEIRKQDKELRIKETTRKKIDKAKEYQEFFNLYKDALKKKRREELERYINQYFKLLMSSNTLIHHIHLSEDFAIQYQDKKGAVIGMGNLSAGMKQLAATALIWALKTCSKKPMPIIVDTPMARIDRGNQENLLKNYYPKVSEQVIILPTDSEMDEAKYKLLTPHIYQEYVLENKSGEQTQIIKQSMYPHVAKETH